MSLLDEIEATRSSPPAVVTAIRFSDGRVLTHVGDLGITLTGIRHGERGLEVRIEVGEDIPRDAGITLIGSFLSQVDELLGESFVAACLAHYAQEKGKPMFQEGTHQFGIIRGGARGTPPRKKGGRRR